MIITLFFGAILIFAAAFFIYDLTHVQRPEQIPKKCEKLEGFSVVRQDERTPVELPCNILVPANEDLVIETTLPDEIGEDTWVCYKSGKDTKIYVGDELRRDFNRKDGTILGGAVKLVYMFIELKPSDAGRTLRVVRCG